MIPCLAYLLEFLGNAIAFITLAERDRIQVN